MPRQQAFRAEVRAWMAVHVPKLPLVTLECREGYEQHVEWERTLAAGNCGMVTWPAAAMQAGDDQAAVHVSHAKLASTDAAILTAETAIQVHGAMGYTYEVDLHFWIKRAWALSGAWGDRAFHVKRIDDAVIGGALPIGPEHTFA